MFSCDGVNGMLFIKVHISDLPFLIFNQMSLQVDGIQQEQNLYEALLHSRQELNGY